MSAAAAEERPGELVKSINFGAFIILLYVFFVFMVFAGFASYIVRTEWEARVATSGGEDLADIDRVLHLILRERQLVKEIADRADRVIATDKALVGAEVDLVRVDGEIERLTRDLNRAVTETRVLFRNIDNKLTDESSNLLLAAAKTDGIEGANDAKLVLGMFPELVFEETVATQEFEIFRAGVAARSGELDATERALGDLTRERLLLQGAVREQVKKLEREEAALISLSDELFWIQGEALQQNSPHRAEHSAIARGAFGWLFESLVSYPTIFLTMIVTIFAGGLGTLVAFSRQVYRRNAPATVSRLFVNLGEGIAAAIGIFLFAGAGTLVLTNGSGFQGGVELNPYAVASVAFVSGFMAEDAFDFIQTAGERIFGGQRDGKPPATPVPSGETPPETPATDAPKPA